MKFGSLSSSVDEPYRVVLIDPKTDEPLVDLNGGEAYIDVLSSQSDAGRKFDRDRQKVITRRAMRNRSQDIVDDDQFEVNILKLARLTKGWHLVDPVSKESIDADFSQDAAVEFYKLPLAFPFYMQAWLAANEPANFMKGSSKP
jgi:hypothetical protein